MFQGQATISNQCCVSYARDHGRDILDDVREPESDLLSEETAVQYLYVSNALSQKNPQERGKVF